MIYLLVFILSFVFQFAYAVDPHMATCISLDQDYNIPSRMQDEITLSVDDKSWKPMKWSWIDGWKIKIFASSQIDSAHFSSIFRKQNDGSYLIPDYVKSDGHQLSLPGGNQSIGKFTRILGRRTTYVDLGEQDLFIKFSPGLTNFPAEFAERSVLLTNYVRELFSNLGIPSRFAIVEEPYAIAVEGSGNFNLNGDGYALVARSTREFHKAFANGEAVYSLHSLFGCADCLSQVAKAQSLDNETWITQEYLPKFAAMLAEAHVRFGLILEAHTQNTLAVIGQNGRIERFLYRDLAGLVIDPTVNFKNDLDVKFENLANPAINKLYTSFTAPNKLYARDFGVHASMYSVQSIDRISETMNRLDMIKAFLIVYRQSAEDIMGTPIHLSGKGDQAWQRLLNAKQAHDLVRNSSRRGDLRDGFAYLMEEIYSSVQQQRLQQVAKQINFRQATQFSSAYELRERFQEKNLFYSSIQARTQVERAFRFSILNPFSGPKIPDLGIYNLNGRDLIVDVDQNRILAFEIRTQGPQENCRSILNLHN